MFRRPTRLARRRTRIARPSTMLEALEERRLLSATGLPIISVVAIDPDANEAGDWGTFRLRRTGATTDELWFRASFTGTADPGADYSSTNLAMNQFNEYFFPVGSSEFFSSVIPLGDLIAEPDETCVLTILPPTSSSTDVYLVDPGAAEATVVIHDGNGQAKPRVRIEATDPEAHENPLDKGLFTVRRLGSTSGNLTVSLSYTDGTAQPVDDFVAPPIIVTILDGSDRVTIDLTPIADGEHEGDQFAIGRILPSPDYTIDRETDTIRIGDGQFRDQTLIKPDKDSNAGRPVGPDPASGQNTVVPGLNGQCNCGAANLLYAPLGNPHPIVSADFTVPQDFFGNPPVTIGAKLTYGSVVVGTVWYDTHNQMPGATLRIAVEADASLLPTGAHEYSLEVSYQINLHGAGLQNYTHTLRGKNVHLNRIDSPFGNRWGLDDVDRLIIGSGGVAIVRGDGTGSWFERTGAGYVTPAGSTTILTGGSSAGWILERADGGRSEFDTSGRLLRRVDRVGNATNYTYIDGDGDLQAFELASMTDPDGRVATYAYASGRLQSRTDYNGRVTTYVFDGTGRLTTVTQAAANPMSSATAPVTRYTYDAAGLMATSEDPEGRVTTYTYEDHRIKSILLPGHSAPTVYKTVATRGLAPAGTGTVGTPAPSVLAEGATATITDPLNRTTIITTDRFGNPTRVVDPLGRVTTYERDANGWLRVLTEPDPDGNPLVGQSAPITTFDYDARGRLTSMGLPGGATRIWTYGVFGQLATYTDENVHTTTYALDPANGNVLAITDPLSKTTDFTYDSHGRVKTVTTPDPLNGLGRATTTYDYDARGRLWKVTHPGGATTTYTYASATLDDLKTVTDERNYTTTYDYDALGRLIAETTPDPDGPGGQDAATTIYVYDLSGRMTSITAPLNRISTFQYDTAGRLWFAFGPDPDGPGAGSLPRPVTAYAYDDADRVTAILDVAARATTYTYDDGDRVLFVGTPNPAVGGPSILTQYTYDNLDRLTKITGPDPDGTSGPLTSAITTFEYDVRNRLKKVTGPDPDGGGSLLAPETTYEYDAVGNVLSITDPNGNTTTFAYDEANRLEVVTRPDPDGNPSVGLPAAATTYTYDALGRLIAVADTLGRTTDYAYDNRNRLVKVTSPDPTTLGGTDRPKVEYGYDLAGNLTSVTDERNYVTTYEYDRRNRLITITGADPAGPLPAPITRFVYDLASRRTAVIDPAEKTWTTQYDGLDRVVAELDPYLKGNTYTYDVVGRLSQVTDAYGKSTLTAYDNRDRVTGVIDQVSAVTQFGYDLADRRVTVTDPALNVTTTTYDALDRVTDVTDPRGKTTHYDYDRGSRLIRVTDRLGRRTEYDYDHQDRRTAERWLNGVGATVRTIASTYDEVGQLLQIADPAATLTFTYDHLGRQLTASTTGPATNQPSVTLASSYDKAGNRTGLADDLAGTGAAGAGSATFTYDALGRLTLLERAFGGVAGPRVAYGYDDDGRLDTIGRTIGGAGTEVRSAFDFDDAGRLTGLVHGVVAGATLATYGYTYDFLGRLTSTTDPADGLVTYTYDDSGQLKTADRAGTAGDEAYTYDGAGNRTMTGYATASGNRVTAANGRTYTYDDEGNRVTETVTATGVVTTYAYDHRNRLVAIDRAAPGGASIVVGRYVYDALDRRIAVTEADDNRIASAWYGEAFNVGFAFLDTSFHRVTVYLHDADNRGRTQRIEVIDAVANTIIATYDAANFADGLYVSWELSGVVVLRFLRTGPANAVLSGIFFDAGTAGPASGTSATFLGTDATTRGDWAPAYGDQGVLIATDRQDQPSYVLFSMSPGLTTHVWDPATADPRALLVRPDEVKTTWTVYDGIHAYADFDAAGVLLTRYTFGPGVDQILARTSAAGVTAWYLADRLGSVRDVVSTSGVILDRITYDAYGRVTHESNILHGDRFKFTGREQDASGLQYSRARYYDASLGRWTQEDPIGFAAGDANLYRYVGNGPTNYTDPSGFEKYAEISSAPSDPWREWKKPFTVNPRTEDWWMGKPSATQWVVGNLYHGTPAKAIVDDVGLLFSDPGQLIYNRTIGTVNDTYELVMNWDRVEPGAKQSLFVNTATGVMIGKFGPSLSGINFRPKKPKIKPDVSAPACSVPQSRSTIEAFADTLQGLPGKGPAGTTRRPTAVARLLGPLGEFFGRSQKDQTPLPHHPVVESILKDLTPAPGQDGMKGRCGEVDAINQALKAHEGRTGKTISTLEQARNALKGSIIQTALVRGIDGTPGVHGTPVIPCTICGPLLEKLGVAYE